MRADVLFNTVIVQFLAIVIVVVCILLLASLLFLRGKTIRFELINKKAKVKKKTRTKLSKFMERIAKRLRIPLLTGAFALWQLFVFLPIALLPFNHELSLQGNTSWISSIVSLTAPPLIEGVAVIRTERGRIYGSSESVTGKYVAARKEIVLQDPYGMNTGTWFHEVGHHLAYFKTTDCDWQRWEQISASSPPPTEYGNTSVQEDFAESHMFFAQYPCSLDAGRRDYFNDLYNQIIPTWIRIECE